VYTFGKYASWVRKAIAELVGTGSLALAVVGSGIMATDLTSNVGLQLLINAGATGAILWLLISLFGPISGAHFNPVVSWIFYLRKESSVAQTLSFTIAQIIGAISGTLLANLIFTRDAYQESSKVRGGWNILLSETVATAGLVFLIFHFIAQKQSEKIAAGVALFIFAAYFFTSSTSFANPAITVGRTFTDSFAGISPASVPAFIPAQIVGAAIGYLAARYFASHHTKESS